MQTQCTLNNCIMMKSQRCLHYATDLTHNNYMYCCRFTLIQKLSPNTSLQNLLLPQTRFKCTGQHAVLICAQFMWAVTYLSIPTV